MTHAHTNTDALGGTWYGSDGLAFCPELANSRPHAQRCNGPKANNNGKIRLSVRQAAECLGVDRKTAQRAFHDLQAKGFIVMTERAILGLSGEAKSPAYEITEIPLHGGGFEGRKLYRKWREGHDFPVTRTAPNNPTGRNGKIGARPRNGDKVVPLLGTN